MVSWQCGRSFKQMIEHYVWYECNMYVSENETGRGKVFKVPVILLMTDVQWLKENKLFYSILLYDIKKTARSLIL